MTTKPGGAIALIVDTNLFLECRSLDQIPWGSLGFDEVVLIVPRPVQQEIDNHKKGIKGRTFKKALAAAATFREIVVAGGNPLTIRESGPRVTLALMAQSKIDPTLAEDLDPAFNDDAIILRMLQYARDNPDTDVRLLTHDTGPMATAQSVGASFIAIPDAWLSNEQDDPSAKENRKLKDENTRLRSQEPKFAVTVRNDAGDEIERLDAIVDHYDDLAAAEIDMLMAELAQRYPLATDFGSAATISQPAPAIGRGISVTEFRPAAAADIEKYRREDYPEWQSQCRKFFKGLAAQLNRRVVKPIAKFEIANVGTRPAAQSLTKFTASGNFVIFPKDRGEKGEGEAETKLLRLPAVPSPPMGRWIRQGLSVGQMAWARQWADPLGVDRSFAVDRLLPRILPPRDADGFYWRDGKPSQPKRQFEVTCESWRHGVDAEIYEIQLYQLSAADVSGAIKLEVHAENLTDPVQVTLPVTLQRNAKSTLERARQFVDPISAVAAKTGGLS